MICRFIRATGDQFLVLIDNPERTPVYDVADPLVPLVDFRDYDRIPLARSTRFYRYASEHYGPATLWDYFEAENANDEHGSDYDDWNGAAWPIWLSPNPNHGAAKLKPFRRYSLGRFDLPISDQAVLQQASTGDRKLTTFPMFVSIKVHALRHGQPLCGFDPRVPADWPEGHAWIDWRDFNDPDKGPGQARCWRCMEATADL